MTKVKNYLTNSDSPCSSWTCSHVSLQTDLCARQFYLSECFGCFWSVCGLTSGFIEVFGFDSLIVRCRFEWEEFVWRRLAVVAGVPPHGLWFVSKVLIITSPLTATCAVVCPEIGDWKEINLQSDWRQFAWRVPELAQSRCWASKRPQSRTTEPVEVKPSAHGGKTWRLNLDLINKIHGK